MVDKIKMADESTIVTRRVSCFMKENTLFFIKKKNLGSNSNNIDNMTLIM